MRHLPGVAFMKNRDGRYVFYNEAAQGLFHLDPVDFLGKTDHEVWPGEYADRLVANDEEVLRTKSLVEAVEAVPHKQGVHHWLIYKFPIVDENDEVQFIGGDGDRHHGTASARRSAAAIAERWKRWGGWRAAWRTTSTICSR